MNKPTISVSAIIKDEQEMLPKMLKSVKGVDEIVIQDTGSTDKSIEIAKEAGAKVFTEYKWGQDKEYPHGNFSIPRNISKSHCTGDWLLIIDGDEELISMIPTIRKLLEEPFMKHKDVILFHVDTGLENNLQPRMFRNSSEIDWVGAAHNKVCIRQPDGSYKDISHGDGVFISTLNLKAKYSPNHKVMPDRTLDIMTHEVNKGVQSIGHIQYTRYLYYISREYLNRQDPFRTLFYLEEYVGIAPPTNEKADAYYIIGTCYLNLNKLEKALAAFLQAVKFLPSFKAAWIMIHNLAAGKHKRMFKKMSQMADNDNVLFVRTSAEVLVEDGKPEKK